MAVKIRLARRGRKKQAIYDIVAADARSPRDGKFIEKLGQYNPNSTPAGITLQDERALYWLMVGAEPTDTVRKILSVKGVMFRKHLQVGVNKGSITQETADARYTVWETEKLEKRAVRISVLSSKADAGKKAKFEAEQKVNQTRLDAITAKNTPVVEEVAEVVEEVVAVSEETTAESTEETPA
jgi:small subunit ribosomal protein S16